MRTRTKGIISVVAAVVLIMALAVPVLATVWDGGVVYCEDFETGYSRSYSTGLTEHWPPGTGYAWWNNGTQWRVRIAYGAQGFDGEWAVAVTNGSLSDPGTWAGCVT